jgi:ubiquinone biosynthesis protein
LGRTFQNLGRLRQITAVIARHGLGHYMAQRRVRRKPKHPEAMAAVIPSAAWRFRNILEELGTTFIKFGQVLSTRADLLPPGFAEALGSLQDNCAAMPFAQVETAIVAGLGQPIDALFASFETTPLASASIAQVHRATTRSGQSVAVKVQRPGIRAQVERDVDLLSTLAQLAENIIEESGMVTPRGVVSEFESALLGELDFCHEARMLLRFRDNLVGKSRTYVVPEVHTALSCETILTMDFIRGTRLSALKPSHDKKAIALNIVQAAFDQLFVDGLFHADPHPGNWFVLDDNRLALIDFGSVGQISYAMRETLVVLVLSVGMGDADAVARLLYRIGIPDERISLHNLRDACASLFADRLSNRANYASLDAAELLGELFELAGRFRVRIPSEYALVGRASVTVEGIIRQLDPKLEVLDNLKPIMRRLLEEQFTLPNLGNSTLKNLLRARDVVRELPTTLSQILMDLEYGKLRIEVEKAHLAAIARNIDTLGLVIFMGIIAGGLVTGSLFILARYDLEMWGLPLVPTLGLYAASMLFGTALGRYFLAPRLRKLSLARWLRRRRR